MQYRLTVPAHRPAKRLFALRREPVRRDKCEGIQVGALVQAG